MTTIERVVKVLHKMGFDVMPSSKFSSLNVDSLDQVEIVLALEDEFGREIPDDISSVDAAVSHIESR